MMPADYVHEDQYYGACNDSQGPSTTGLDKKRAPCRYYRSGSCRRGSNCPFAHPSVAAWQAETPTIPHPPYQAELPYELAYAYALGQTPVYHLSGSQAHPIFLWQPYPPLSPLFDPRYGLARQAEPLIDYPDDKSDPSTAESSSSVTSLDYRVRMALHTTQLESVESGAVHRLAGPPADIGINSPPGCPVYAYPKLSGVKSGHVVRRGRATSAPHPDPVSTAAQPSPFLLPWHDDMRKKPLAYKTKPCKFYAANGKCTSGEKCTFIHDTESKEIVDSPRTELVPPVGAKLPPKPRDRYEEYHARDFYPITWRVIGGGVMMGGKRQICPTFAAGHCKYGDDCKFAHETELETDLGFVKLKHEGVRKEEEPLSSRIKGTPPKRARSGSQNPKPPRVPSGAVAQQPVHFPLKTPQRQEPSVPSRESTEEVRKKDEGLSVPTSPVHRRTRSMSMVHTSPPLDTAQSNFAAEL